METVGAACLVLGCVGGVSGLALAAQARRPARVRRLAGATFAGAAGVAVVKAPLAGWGGPLAAGLAGALAGAVLAGGVLTFIASRSEGAASGRSTIALILGLASIAGALAQGWLPAGSWLVVTLGLGFGLVAAAFATSAAGLRWGARAGLAAALAIVALWLPMGSAAEWAMVVAAASAAAPLATLAGVARRALVPAISRGLAAAAAALAGWSVAASLAWRGDLVVAPAIVLAVAAVVAVDAPSGRRLLLPRRGADPEALDVGDHALGRYRLLARLGEGTFSTAWRALDEETGGQVAVKVLREDRAGSSALPAEAAALRDVMHPNVVRLLDVGTEGRQTCLVMELVEGGSLADRIARGPIDTEALARVGADLLDALGAVHAAGIVHRDVKPSNVLLTKDGRAKLADFGIALVSDVEATLGGDAGAGSIRFMSPEQASGRRIDARSDLYSAAATLYEAYTGEPFAKGRLNESAVELRMRISEGLPVAADLPGGPGLRAWFEKSLSPNAATRFPTAALMRDALRDATHQS